MKFKEIYSLASILKYTLCRIKIGNINYNKRDNSNRNFVSITNHKIAKT